MTVMGTSHQHYPLQTLYGPKARIDLSLVRSGRRDCSPRHAKAMVQEAIGFNQIARVRAGLVSESGFMMLPCS